MPRLNPTQSFHLVELIETINIHAAFGGHEDISRPRPIKWIA